MVKKCKKCLGIPDGWNIPWAGMPVCPVCKGKGEQRMSELEGTYVGRIDQEREIERLQRIANETWETALKVEKETQGQALWDKAERLRGEAMDKMRIERAAWNRAWDAKHALRDALEQLADEEIAAEKERSK